MKNPGQKATQEYKGNVIMLVFNSQYQSRSTSLNNRSSSALWTSTGLFTKGWAVDHCGPLQGSSFTW